MKHLKVSEIIERRIRKGDYSQNGIPAERDLAADIGTSRVTVRRALDALEDKGLLERGDNRRLRLSAAALASSGRQQLGLVSPANVPSGISLDLQRWQATVETAARAANARVRVVHYHHWDDPALADALRSFDGVFLVTNSEPIPAWTRSMLEKTAGVVSLSDDLTDLTIPSLRLFPPAQTKTLLEHLRSLGHRRIECFNVQGHNAVTSARIDEWAGWTALNGAIGTLHDHPCDLETNIFDFASEQAKRVVKDLHSEATAVFCVTLPAAMGLVRAASEVGLKVGEDLSVCVVDGEGLAKHLVPSLTSFDRPEFTSALTAIIDWLAQGASRSDWIGPLLVEPSRLELFQGESTGPPRSTEGGGV